MFQISRRVDYAVRIMIELALNEGQCIPARQISSSTNVPKAFLHKISADLVKADLITTQAGPHGGLQLNRAADQINLQQVVEAIEGPICLNICLIKPQECKRDSFCPAHDFWGEMQSMIIDRLQNTYLTQLVASAHDLMQNPRRREHIPYLIHHEAINVLPLKMGEQHA